MCVRSVRGLLDRRLGSEVDDVRRAWGSRGPPWSLSISSLKRTRRAAGGGVRLRRRDRPGCLVSWRCSGVSPCTLEAWGLPGLLRGANGRRGLLYVPKGEPLPGGGPRGWSGEFRRAPVWGTPGRLGTAVAGGLRRVPGGPVIKGCSRYYGPAWPHGCAGRRAGATASAVRSFHLGCRLPYAP